MSKKRLLTRKWRPTLRQLLFCALVTVLCLPLASLFLFRLYENQLIRETEAELIAQSAALAAIFARDVENSPVPLQPFFRPVMTEKKNTREIEKSISKSAFSSMTRKSGENPFQPIIASLDLTSSEMQGIRPPPKVPDQAANIAYRNLGQKLQGILQNTQRVTLAGFRLLDPNGVVIAGRSETGMSLAHIDEVAAALNGQYRAMLRMRVVDEPPPLYSLSRGTRVRIFVAMPVMVNGQVAGIVYASRTPNNIIRHIYEERGKFILSACLIVLLTYLIGHILVRGIAQPLRKLVICSEEIGRGEREEASMQHYGTQEIFTLAQGLTDMAQKLNQRSRYISTFAAHVSHELKSPLTSIQGAAEILRDDTETPDGAMDAGQKQHFLDNIIADTTRAGMILNRLRELARADNPQESGETELSGILEKLQEQFENIAIKCEGNAHIILPMAAENAEIVFLHLADNARRHHADEIVISAYSREGQKIIRVKDNGEGVSANNQDKIFDAFFTTRRASGGTGMGLGIVQAMLQAHQGIIRFIRDEEERGATFEIIFSKGI